MEEIKIPKKLYKDIAAFCELNSFDIGSKIIEFLTQGFNISKYGTNPFRRETIQEVKPSIEKENTTQIEETEPIKEKPKTRKVKIIKS